VSRIFLVDDHAMVRDGLRAVLEAAGHRVLGEADEPTRALGEVLRLAPEVLLLDIHLGGRSGLELLSELQRRNLPLRVIVLTMSAQPHHVAEAIRLGAAGYVLKGSPASEVLQAIDSVLNGRRYLGGEVADLALQVLTGEAGNDPLAGLSPRERQIVVMVARGQSSAQIGQQLHLSPKTVDTYRSRLMAKLGVPDMAALVRFAVKRGLVDAEPG
jgi:two-component system invasion response regulator UvrY